MSERIVILYLPLGCNQSELLPHDQDKGGRITGFDDYFEAARWIRRQAESHDWVITWEPSECSPILNKT